MPKAFSVSDVPDLTTEQMVEVDRAMIEDYRIELIQMMENAGRNLAHLARTRFLDGDPRGRPVLALAGGGGNGGGALVATRRLSNWGANVTVVLGQAPSKMTPVPGHQLDILSRMGVRIVADAMPPGTPIRGQNWTPIDIQRQSERQSRSLDRFDMIAIPAGAVVTFAGYCLDGAMDQAIISADLEGFRAGQSGVHRIRGLMLPVGLITRIGPRWTRVDSRALERQLLPCQ